MAEDSEDSSVSESDFEQADKQLKDKLSETLTKLREVDENIDEKKRNNVDDGKLRENINRVESLLQHPEERRPLIEKRFEELGKKVAKPALPDDSHDEPKDSSTSESQFRPTPTEDEEDEDEERPPNLRPPKSSKPEEKEAESSDDDEEDDEYKRLGAVLRNCKIANSAWVIQQYSKKINPTRRIAAQRLNKLMLTAGNESPKKRQIAVATYFSDLSEEVIDRIFAEEENLDDGGGNRGGAKDDNELVTVPIRDKNGAILLDINKKPIFKQVTKAELFWSNSAGVAGGSSSASGLEIAEMMSRNQDKMYGSILGMKDKESEFWKSNAMHDPFKSVADNIQKYKALGLVGEPEKQSEYQKAMVQETRGFLKEGFNETKGELKPLFESLREDVIKPIMSKVFEDEADAKAHGAPVPIRDMPPNELDAAFEVLESATNLPDNKKNSKKR